MDDASYEIVAVPEIIPCSRCRARIKSAETTCPFCGKQTSYGAAKAAGTAIAIEDPQ